MTTDTSQGGITSDADRLTAFATTVPEGDYGELWSLLDWSFWGAGMGDVLREPLATAMLAAVPADIRALAETVMADFIERRKIEKTGVTIYQEQKAEVERLREELAQMTMARDAFAELYKVEESRTASERATAAETEGARLREELGWTSAARDKARAALGVIFDDAELLITPVIAAHVLAHFGRGGYVAGSFTADLIMLIARADPDNRARLLCPFPGYVSAVNLAQNTTTGIDRLAEIAALDVPDADA